MNTLKVISVLIRLEGGGAERSVARLVDPLAKRGITLTRYAIDGPWPGETGDPNRTLTTGPSRGMRRIFTAALNLAKVIRIEQPNVLHLHCEAPEIVGLITRLLTLNRKYGIVVTDHSMRSWSGKRAALGAAVRSILRHFQAKYVNCYLPAGPADDVPVVLNPTGPIGRLSSEDDRPPRLVVIGRVIESKRIDHVLRAAQLASWPSEVLIVGAGSASADLENLANKLGLSVTFLGHQGDPWTFVNKNDIFVSASAFEGEPLTLIEALQYNLPVLVSNIPAHIKVLGDHQGIFSTTCQLAKMLAEYYHADRRDDLFRVNHSLLQAILSRRNPDHIALEWDNIYRDATQPG